MTQNIKTQYNKNLFSQNEWGATKAMLVKFRDLNEYIKRGWKSLSIHLKKLEKEQQLEHKIKGNKEQKLMKQKKYTKREDQQIQ